jgi:hypothetical protein
LLLAAAWNGKIAVLAGAEMRWASLLFCCLFLAFTVAGSSAPLLAADVEPPRQGYPGDRSDDDDAQTEREVAEYCYVQGEICRKICYLRSNFEDRVDGCPNSCETRVIRCSRTGCYRWPEPEFLIAERFGGYKCYQ